MKKVFQKFSTKDLALMMLVLITAILSLYLFNRIDLANVFLYFIIFVSLVAILSNNEFTYAYEDMYFTIFLIGYCVLQYSSGDQKIDIYDYFFMGIIVCLYMVIANRMLFIPVAILASVFMIVKIVINIS